MSNPSIRESAQHTSLTAPFRYYPSGLPDLLPFIAPHWHPEFEINVISSGSAAFCCNGERYLTEVGDIFVCPPNETHSMTALEGETVHYDTLLFTADAFGAISERGNHALISPLVNGSARVVQPIRRGDRGYDALHSSIMTAVCAAKENSPAGDLLIKGALCRFIYELYQFGHVSFRRGDTPIGETRIRDVLTYIDTHFAEPMSIDQLARLIPLSTNYFMTSFRQFTGMSIVAYITQVRIKNACDLLRRTDRQIMTIAFDCGFHNLSNFNRQFKKSVGCSPLQYRKSFRKDSKPPEDS